MREARAKAQMLYTILVTRKDQVRNPLPSIVPGVSFSIAWGVETGEKLGPLSFQVIRTWMI